MAKTKEQYWINYLEEYFSKKDILRESDFKRYGELAEMDIQKEILRRKPKR